MTFHANVLTIHDVRRQFICQDSPCARIKPMTPFQQKQLSLMRQMEVQSLTGSTKSTVVPILADYGNDQQLSLTTVAFLSSEVARTIHEKIIEPLSSLEPDFYYYQDTSMHLTINNIRVISNPPQYSQKDIATAQRLLSELIPQYRPFRIAFTGVLRMPTSLSVIALVTPEYDRFVRVLRRKLFDRGIPDDKQYFTDEMIFGNTTVCRFTHQPSQKFISEVSRHRSAHFGDMDITEVSLIETNAGCHPSKTHIFDTYRFRQTAK